MKYCNRDQKKLYCTTDKYRIYNNPEEKDPDLLDAGIKKIQELREINCYKGNYNMFNVISDDLGLEEGISICSYPKL